MVKRPGANSACCTGLKSSVTSARCNGQFMDAYLYKTSLEEPLRAITLAVTSVP